MMKFIVKRCKQSSDTDKYTLTLSTQYITKTSLGTKTTNKTYYINGIEEPLEEDKEIEFDLRDYKVVQKPFTPEDSDEIIMLSWLEDKRVA